MPSSAPLLIESPVVDIHAMHDLLNGYEAQVILDSLDGDWTTGGAHVLARALLRLIPQSTPYGIVGKRGTTRMKTDTLPIKVRSLRPLRSQFIHRMHDSDIVDNIQHMVIGIKDNGKISFLDAVGFFTKERLLDYWRKEMRVIDAVLVHLKGKEQLYASLDVALCGIIREENIAALVDILRPCVRK